MAYTKTSWVNDAPPAINATNLNKMEQGIYDAHVRADKCLLKNGSEKMTGDLWIEKTGPKLILNATAGNPQVSYRLGGTEYVLNYLTTDGSEWILKDVPNNVVTFRIERTTGSIKKVGHIIPTGAGVKSLGDATNYWNEVNYKVLADRGCLGICDEGVELPNGKIVSDVEAIKAMKKHPEKRTTYGVPRIDYKTMPKIVYKAPDGIPCRELKRELEKELKIAKSLAKPNKAEIKRIQDEIKRVNKWISERGKDAPSGDEGADVAALISIILGAIKELDTRLEKLELNGK